jgi:uncharacterized protein YndB with AHSA1/START domain
MRTVQQFVTSARADTIWQVLVDVEHWPKWNPTILQITPLTNDGLRIGARYRVVQRKLRPAVYEVTECTPNHAFTWVQKLPGGEMIADHRISPGKAETEVELSFRSSGFLANLLGMVFSKLICEYVATEAMGLKRHCESL